MWCLSLMQQAVSFPVVGFGSCVHMCVLLSFLLCACAEFSPKPALILWLCPSTFLQRNAKKFKKKAAYDTRLIPLECKIGCMSTKTKFCLLVRESASV